MLDTVSLHNLIPGHKIEFFEYTKNIRFSDSTCYSLLINMSLYKYFKRVDVSASLPDLKGPLSNYIPTISIAEANKEVLKVIAKVKEPQKKGSSIKVTPEYKAKVAKLVSSHGNSIAARKYSKLLGKDLMRTLCVCG